MKKYIHARFLLAMAACATMLIIITASLVIPTLGVHAAPAALPPTWFQLAPGGTLPTGRANFGHAIGYDTTNNRMIFFGGDNNGTLLNDTWVLVGADGTIASPQWIQLNTVNTPAPRKSHAGAYDATNNILIIYGGCLGACTPIDNNVYTLSNANGLGGTPTWTQLSTSGGPPPSRDGTTAVYDPTTNSLIIFGGDNCCGTRFNDTWVLSNANGLGGTPTWTQLSTTGSIPARVGHSAVYDTTHNRMIVFGGSDCCGNLLNDTWVLSNANGSGGTPTWTQLAPTGTPPAVRVQNGAIYNGATSHMLIFGGSNTGFLNDVWMLTHANGLGGTPAWKQLTPVSTSPTARNSFAMIYRAANKRLVIFGGTDTSNADVNDTWVLMNVS